MSFQGYLDTIKAKTGLGPDDFRRLAAARGLDAPDTKAGSIVGWLAQDYGLGRGHAMAIVSILKDAGPASIGADPADELFSGPRARWRGTWDAVWAHAAAIGSDVAVQPTQKYLGLVRGGRKFAIVAATGDRFDIGYKLGPHSDREGLHPAGAWNRMVTHRASLGVDDALDGDHLRWLTDAYEQAGG